MTEEEAKKKYCKNWATSIVETDWATQRPKESRCFGSECMGWPQCKAAWETMERLEVARKVRSEYDVMCKCGHTGADHMGRCMICDCRSFEESP